MKKQLLLLSFLFVFVACEDDEDLVPSPSQPGSSTGLSPTPCPNSPVMVDIDGNTYSTALIGDQCWCRENLKTTKYRDGSPIGFLMDNSSWANTNGGAYSLPNGGVDVPEVYGKIYNGWAVVDPRGLCPEGWHIPTHQDLTTLTDNIGGLEGTMRTLLSTTWNTQPYFTSNDSTGFSALPVGGRDEDGDYVGVGHWTYIWSSTVAQYEWSNPTVPYTVWVRGLAPATDIISAYGEYMNRGFSCRCVKD